MRTFVCTIFWCVCLQIGVLLPPSWFLGLLVALAVAQDWRELFPPEPDEEDEPDEESDS